MREPVQIVHQKGHQYAAMAGFVSRALKIHHAYSLTKGCPVLWNGMSLESPYLRRISRVGCIHKSGIL